MKNLLCYLILFVALLGFAHLGYAYVASSANYRIEADSVNNAGILSTSTSYDIQDTLGESGTGTSTGASYKIYAGYQQMTASYISISSPSDVSMSPAISSGGGVGDGSTSWTVTTDDPLGYTLALSASTDPALTSSDDGFSNYITASVGTPDFIWSVAADHSEFGFTPEGSDITSTYKDDGSNCATGSLDTGSRCWDSITTTQKIIASASSANNPTGTGTTVRLRAEVGTSHGGQKAGNYTATITGTAIAQ